MADNGLTAALNSLLSNSSVTERSLAEATQINEVGYRIAAGRLQIAANGNVHIPDLSTDVLTIGVFGNTTIDGWANISGDLIVAGALKLANTVSANGSVGTAGYVLTSGGAGANVYWSAATGGGGGGGGNAYGTIEVSGQANLVAQSVNAVALLVADSGIALTTNVASDGALHVGGVVANTTVQGDVSTAAQSFAGVKTFTANTECNGYVNVGTTLQVAGNVAVANLLVGTSNTTVSLWRVTANAIVDGWTNIAGALVVGGLSHLVGNTSIDGFANVGTTLQVAGVTTLNGNLAVANLIAGTTNTTVALLTLTPNTIVNGLLTANASANVNGYVNVSSTLQVAANALFSGAQINVATGNAHIGNRLVVDGLSTLTGNVTMSGFANIGTTLQVTSTTLLNANLTVNATAIVNTAIQVGTNPATTGVLQLPNNGFAKARNAGNSADKSLIGLNASDKVSIDADALGAIFGAGITVSGGQVAFPASQNASSDANTLDDYEEGTWTPTIIGTTSTSGQAYSIQVGHYVKIGRMVHVTFNVQLSTKGTIVGALAIGGLPFTSENVTNYIAPLNLALFANMVTSLVNLGGFISSNSTGLLLIGLTGAA